MGTSGQVARGHVPLTQWQVDVIGPLPSSKECKYAITGENIARGLLAAYPTWHPDQKAVIAALEQLCAAYGRPLIIKVIRDVFYWGLGIIVGSVLAD